MVGVRQVVAAFVLAAALGACSAGSSGQSVVAGESSNVAASLLTARVHFESYIGSETPNEVVTTPGEGVVDFLTGALQLVEMTGTARFTLLVTADGGTFVGRDTTTGRSWVHVPDADASPPSPTDPVSLVADLRAAASRVDDAGSGDSHGDVTTRFRLVLPNGVPDSLPIRRFVTKAPATATIDVDAEGRLRKILVEPDNPERPPADASGGGIVFQPVYATWSLELWDFGVEAAVTAPEPDHVVELNADSRADAILEGNASESEISADALAPAGTGTWESVTWTMRTGTDDAGDTCAAFVLDPNDRTNGTNPTPGCFAPLDRAMPFEVVRSSQPDDPFWFVAALAAPEVDAVDVSLADGTVVPIPIDTDDHAFVLFDHQPLDVDSIHVLFEDGTTKDCNLGFDDSGYFMSCPGG